jgi:NitT/TauT family transport system substrate-binding protein
VNDPGALAVLRQRYSEGIPRRPIAEEEADARGLYKILADIGGVDLVGPGRELDAGSFYRRAQGD